MIRKTIALCALLFAGVASAQTKISGLTALAAAPASGDLVAIVDVSDTTQAATGTTKKITASNLFLFAFSNANTFTAAQTAQITDAGTNTVVYPLITDHQSSGTPANGIGSGIAFKTETSAGNTETGATIEAVTSDVTAASEDFCVYVKSMVAGSTTLVEGGRFCGSTFYASNIAHPSSSTMVLNNYVQVTTGGINLEGNSALGWSSGWRGKIWSPEDSVIRLSDSAGTAFNRLQFGGTTSSYPAIKRSGTTLQVVLADDTGIQSLLGGGAAVAAAAALPVPTGRVFHVTGTTGITSITSTNFGSGACVTMIFDDALTVTDGSNLKLAGDFTTTADDTLSVCYDGTSWFETGRSVN